MMEPGGLSSLPSRPYVMCFTLADCWVCSALSEVSLHSPNPIYYTSPTGFLQTQGQKSPPLTRVMLLCIQYSMWMCRWLSAWVSGSAHASGLTDCFSWAVLCLHCVIVKFCLRNFRTTTLTLLSKQFVSSSKWNKLLQWVRQNNESHSRGCHRFSNGMNSCRTHCPPFLPSSMRDTLLNCAVRCP